MEQRNEGSAELFPVHDQIDQAMILEEFGSLKARRQILVGRFSNNARASESDHAFWFGQYQVAERSKAGHDPRGSRMGENGDIRQSRFGVTTQSPTGLGHLH